MPVGEYLFSGLAAALGVAALVGASLIHVPESSNSMGPQVFPLMVGTLLTASGAAVFISVIFGRRGAADEAEDLDSSAKTDWLTVVKLVAFFLATAFLIPIIGWPFASALLFFGTAWSLGAKKLLVTALSALAVGFIIQLLFGVGLGLSLPAGPLLEWIPLFRG